MQELHQLSKNVTTQTLLPSAVCIWAPLYHLLTSNFGARSPISEARLLEEAATNNNPVITLQSFVANCVPVAFISLASRRHHRDQALYFQIKSAMSLPTPK